jgi:anti-sigma B factor antagonist
VGGASREEPVLTETQFEIRSSWDGENAIFEVYGEVDMATAPELTGAVEAAVDAARLVVVDLTEATFLDSAAINGLIRCRRELDRRGVAFAVVSPPDGVVRKALEITNVVDRLGVVDSRPDTAV